MIDYISQFVYENSENAIDDENEEEEDDDNKYYRTL